MTASSIDAKLNVEESFYSIIAISYNIETASFVFIVFHFL
jgi:hypothetical protein